MEKEMKKQMQMKSKYFRRTQRTNIVEILARFLRFMARKVSTRPCEFDVRKGLIKQNKVTSSRILISVRDPFNRYLNHGASLQDKGSYRNIVQELTNLLEAACEPSQSRLIDYVYAEPIDSSDIY